MSETTTVTIRVPITTKEKLDQLAAITRRTRTFLAADAITAYVDQELAIVGDVLRGMEDKKAGRVVPHEKAMTELRQRVKRAAAKGRRKSA